MSRISDGKSNRNMRKTPHQLMVLEKAYASAPTPSKLTAAKLSKDLGLTYAQVRGWFKRRRARTLYQWRLKQSPGSESNFRQSVERLGAANILGPIASHDGSHVDVSRVNMEERTPPTDGKQDEEENITKRLSGSVSDSGSCNEPLVGVERGGNNIKNNMIDMLIKENERDEAKYQSVKDQLSRLEKSIEDRKKLLDDIRKVCC